MSLEQDAWSLNSQAWNLFMEGKTADAEKIAHKALRIFEDQSLEEGLNDTRHLLGDIDLFQGNLKQALEYYQECLPLFKEIQYMRLPFTLINIGIIYRHHGYLNKALDYFNQAYKHAQHHSIELSWVLTQFGELHYQKNELKDAYETLKKSYSLFEGKGNLLFKATPIFWLIPITIDLGILDQTQKYLHELFLLHKEGNSIYITQFYQVAKAMVLSLSARFRDQSQAGELLQQVADGPQGWFWVRVYALILLCEIHIFEFQSTQDLAILGELKDNVNKLVDISTNHKMYSVLVDSHILKSKLALIDLDLKEARNQLQFAENISNENKLRLLQKKVMLEQKDFEEKLIQWERLSTSNSKIADLIILSHLEDQILNMAKRKIKSSKIDAIEYAIRARKIVSKMDVD